MQNGLSIWKVHLDVLREQDLNARVMDGEKFSALVHAVEQDKRLESLPLCTWQINKAGNEELGLISGHHRTRAARAASVMEIFVMVFDEKLDAGWLKAKQLAHNSINGVDDPQKVAEIYNSIEELKAKIASTIKPEQLKYEADNIKSEDLRLKMDFEILNILFLSNQKEDFELALKLIQADSGENIFVAEYQAFDKFKKAAQKVSKADNIRNVSSILYRMIQIVKNHYEKIEMEKSVEGNNQGTDQAV